MKIRIGTRNSPLALWQAKEVEQKLNLLGCDTEIVPVISSGDKNLTQPLYAMGITGVFTRDLDTALLNNEIDIAVHSLKDIPTQLPENLQISAVLERDFPQDILIRNTDARTKPVSELKIATSSLRRRAFWLNELPNTQFCDIRGNIQTRLRKLEEGLADATMLSLAGIKRMEMDIDYEELPWILPAPSQGVVAIVNKMGNETLNEILSQINHKETQICIDIERDFLRHLEGGCTAPIGAFAEIKDNQIHFQGKLSSLDGTQQISIKEDFLGEKNSNWGEKLANQILEQGGREMMDVLKFRN